MASSRVSNYEQGTREPSMEDIIALSAALRCSPADLLGLVTDQRLTDDETALLLAYRSTDDRGRETIRQIADAQPASNDPPPPPRPKIAE